MNSNNINNNITTNINTSPMTNTIRGNNSGYFSSSSSAAAAAWGEHDNVTMIRPHSNVGYSREWDHDIVLHRSRQNTSISLRDSVNSSNSLGNSYTTTDSNSGNGLSQDRSIEGNYSNWNTNISTTETPTTALHRRLRTFLHRHLPQNKPNTVVTTNLAPTSSSFDNRIDGYDIYEGRWRR